MGGNRFPALLRGGRQAAIGFGIALIAFGNGATHEAHQGLLVADQGHTAGILAPVRSPIAGTVVAVRAADHQYVTAGSVLISLSASRYRSAIARAEDRRTAAHAHVRAALAALASQERAASAQVRAAMAALRTAPRATLQTRRGPPPVPAALTSAQLQAAAAQARLVQIAGAQAAAAQATVDRDSTLLAEGLISAREAAADAQAAAAARADAAAAAAALRDAQAAAGRPGASSASPDAYPAQAQPALATAQAAVEAAARDQAGAQETLDRDKVLLADGAIPANQVDRDTEAYEAASARIDAASAALKVVQAQRASMHTPSRPAAMPTPTVEAAPFAEQRLADRAEATIAEAQRRAATLAAAQVDALSADRALDEAKTALSKTLIRAPVNGWVTNSSATLGQEVQPGQTLMALSIQGRTWVAASVPAKNVSRIHVGSRAMVTVSGYRGRVWLGRVLQVSSGSGEPAGLEQGARGVEVQIGLDSAQGRGQLPGGLTADVAIDTRAIPSVLPTTPEAPGPAASRPPRSSPAAGEPSDPQLTQIGEQERRILAQLNAESEQIHKIIVGAAPGAHGGVTPSFLNDGLAWPVSGTVSSGYGWRIHPIFHTPEFHTGIDIATPWGAPVEAADDGVVIFTGQMTANGKLIIVDHGNGLSTMYSHLSSYDVHAGDRVRRGETIGRVGSTGWSTGPHLFFELRRDGQPLDPIEP